MSPCAKCNTSVSKQAVHCIPQVESLRKLKVELNRCCLVVSPKHIAKRHLNVECCFVGENERKDDDSGDGNRASRVVVAVSVKVAQTCDLMYPEHKNVISYFIIRLPIQPHNHFPYTNR